MQKKLTAPKAFIQIKNFMGLIHDLKKHFPAQAAATLCPLLKNIDKKDFDWKTQLTTTFEKVLKILSSFSENEHFDLNLEKRVACDVSTFGLGAALGQITDEGWDAIAFSPKQLEEKRSELQFLGVVWAIVHFS